MTNLPDNYTIDNNLGWEDFKVNTKFDNSYERLNFDSIEYISDIFITYLPGGINLTVDKGRKRRVVIKVNRSGHSAYPDLTPGDGYMVTIYNDDMGTAQVGSKPVRLVAANENYLVFRGHEVLAMGPFGLIDPGNTDYGFAIFLENQRIKKIALYRYDTRKSYEYANTSAILKRLPINLLGFNEKSTYIDKSRDYTDINYDIVKRNVDAYLKKFSSMGLFTKMRVARETDRIFNIGVKYWRNNEQKTALKYFADALEIFPINTDVIGIYGDYYEYSDYDKSMKFYELAISLNSLRKKDYYQLANFYKWKGEDRKAAECYLLWEEVKKRGGIKD